jgi:16S rRNA (cytosine1402-N4)-methyltransferase
MSTAAPTAHEPVLLEEAMGFLAPHACGTYCDATVGMGGHAAAILERCAPNGRVVGIDRDREALGMAGQALARFGERAVLAHAPFSRMRVVLESAGALPLDGCIADLGVSSVQLDRAERGFSFRRSGPLDMRMDQSAGESAADLLDRVDEEELERVLRDLGEERFARRIARAIVEARGSDELATTGGLAELVARSVPRRERGKDPATRVFQALRIAVNDELGELDRFLQHAPACLKPGGRLVVIAFHSLEDRMVKRRFRALAGAGWGDDEGRFHGEGRGQRDGRGDDEGGFHGEGRGESAGRGGADHPRLRILTKHVVTAGEPELERNPRSRSAKLRAAERLA